MYDGQMIEIPLEAVVQAGTGLDRLLHTELRGTDQLDGRTQVIRGLVTELHHGRQGAGILLGVLVDGTLPLTPDRTVTGIQVASRSEVDHCQQTEGDAQHDQNTRL